MSPRNLFTYEMRRTSAIKFSIEVLLETYGGPKSYLRIARIFEDNEQWDKAKIIYNKILKYETDESKFVQERLEWIEKNSQVQPNQKKITL